MTKMVDMKKKEAFDDDGEETSADLSEFDDYKPFEGEDEIENLDDDFAFLNGKSEKKEKAAKADKLVREVDDFDFNDKDNEQKDLTAKQESADKADLAPAREEKIVERIVIKEVEQKKQARPVRPLDVKPKMAAVNAVKRPAETDFFREHTEHIKVNVEPVRLTEVKKHSNGYLKQLQRDKIARKKTETEEKEKESIAPAAAKEPESKIPEKILEKPAQKDESKEKKTEHKQPLKVEHNHHDRKKKLKHKIFRRERKEDKEEEVEVKHKTHNEKKAGNSALKTLLIVLVIIAAIAGTYYFITYAQKNQAIASVNGDKITLDNFNRQLNVFIFTEAVPADVQAKIDKDAYLAILITETIMQKEAEKKRIGVTDITVADEMKLIFNSTPYAEGSLMSELASKNIAYDDFKNFVKRKKSEQNLMEWASVNYVVDENKSLEVYSQLYGGKGASYDSVKEAIKLGLYRSEVKKQYNVSFFVPTLNAAEVPTKFEQCIYDNGAAKDTIIFYYSEKSDISMEMKPITLNLKSLGYKFYYSEISENSWLDILKCFDKKTEGIPQFICAGTQEVMLGKVEGVTLKAFADKCREEALKKK